MPRPRATPALPQPTLSLIVESSSSLPPGTIIVILLLRSTTTTAHWIVGLRSGLTHAAPHISDISKFSHNRRRPRRPPHQRRTIVVPEGPDRKSAAMATACHRQARRLDVLLPIFRFRRVEVVRVQSGQIAAWSEEGSCYKMMITTLSIIVAEEDSCYVLVHASIGIVVRRRRGGSCLRQDNRPNARGEFPKTDVRRWAQGSKK